MFGKSPSTEQTTFKQLCFLIFKSYHKQFSVRLPDQCEPTGVTTLSWHKPQKGLQQSPSHMFHGQICDFCRLSEMLRIVYRLGSPYFICGPRSESIADIMREPLRQARLGNQAHPLIMCRRKSCQLQLQESSSRFSVSGITFCLLSVQTSKGLLNPIQSHDWICLRARSSW